MLDTDLHPGRQYGLRLNPKAVVRESLLHVQLIAKVGRGGKLKVRHLDGEHAGLEEFVHARQVICRWGDRKPFLRDERRLDELRHTTKQRRQPVIEDAVNVVMMTTGEDLSIDHYGVFGGEAEALGRVSARAGVGPEPLDPLAHVDRHGSTWMTLQGGLRLAQAFAAAEPDGVHLFVENEEAELKAQGYGDRRWHDHLLQRKPAFALARQWAGHEAEVESLRAEIARLRTLVERGALDLERAGVRREANALRRRLRSGR